MGSTRLLVRLFARFKSLFNILPQCMGRNTTPFFISAESFAFTRTLPLCIENFYQIIFANIPCGRIFRMNFYETIH